MRSVKGSDAEASQSTENRMCLSCFPGLVTKGLNLRSIRVLCESSRGTVQNAVAAQLRRAAGRQPSVDDQSLQPNARPALRLGTQKLNVPKAFAASATIPVAPSGLKRRLDILVRHSNDGQECPSYVRIKSWPSSASCHLKNPSSLTSRHPLAQQPERRCDRQSRSCY